MYIEYFTCMFTICTHENALYENYSECYYDILNYSPLLCVFQSQKMCYYTNVHDTFRLYHSLLPVVDPGVYLADPEDPP